MSGSSILIEKENDSEDRSTGSITAAIRDVNDGHAEAVNHLLIRLYESAFYKDAVRKARLRLVAVGAGQFDGEDIVQQALLVLSRRAQRGGLQLLDSRKQLFSLLELIVATEIRDALRKSEARKRIPGSRTVSGDGPAAGDQMLGDVFSKLADSKQWAAEESAIVADVLQTLRLHLEAIYGENNAAWSVLDGLVCGKTPSEIGREMDLTVAEVRAWIGKIRVVIVQQRPDVFSP